MPIDFDNLTPGQQEILQQSQAFLDDLKARKGEDWATAVHTIAMFRSVVQEFSVRTLGGKVPQWAIDRIVDISTKTVVNMVNIANIGHTKDKELADDADALLLIATVSAVDSVASQTKQ